MNLEINAAGEVFATVQFYYSVDVVFPKAVPDFYIAQKVGSIQEEADQRGLAHFLEHMCFNGTTHFPEMCIRDR